jgi:hypothetical protein
MTVKPASGEEKENREEYKQDNKVKEMTNRFAAVCGTDLEGRSAAASAGSLEPSLSAGEVHIEFGEQIYVLPDTAGVGEFLANFPCQEAGEFKQNQWWNKQSSLIESKEQEARLDEIIARLRGIEAQLMRLEDQFKFINVHQEIQP